MKPLLNVLLGLLRLRAGPQDLPVSWPLTALVFAVFVALGILTSQGLGGEDNAGRTLLSVFIQLLAVMVLLRLRGHPERLPQTLLAFAATGIVVSLVAFGFLVQADPERNQPLLALAWFVVFGWSLAVDANIYRHALAVPMAQGVLISVVVLGISYAAMQLLFQGQ